MKTAIYYYTGTGNSLWTAHMLAAEIGNTRLFSMAQEQGPADADAVGLVFPVHMWGVPSLALRFLEKMTLDPGKYYFAFAVNAGQVSRTLVQLRNLLKNRGVTLSAGFDIVLPSNYLPWGGPGPAEKLEPLYRDAREKIKKASALITGRQTGPLDKGPLWQRIVFTALYKMTFNMVPKMDKNFWADDACNGCAMCANVCPVENISMKNDRPEWLRHCEQCLACIQWCPKESIQFGKKTPAYDRYHHPEIKIKDMFVQSGKKGNRDTRAD
jgi:Fe-S-cluster-containing hydrogenase component 2